MDGRSVENEIEIRADIKTRALLSRGSTDIYADICTVYVSNSMSFSTVCRQVRNFSAGVGSGAQWLSGRVLDSRPKGSGFEPHRRHCVVVLEQDTFILA